MAYTEEQVSTGVWVRKLAADSYRGWKAFYHTTKWKTKRAAILKRDHYSCRLCRAKGRYKRANTVHHIKHLKDAPELALDDDNLVSLCADCHEAQHPEKHKRRRGYENEEKW